MRFLVDNNLPLRFAEGLRAAGHDAVHLREVGLADALDDAVFDAAVREQRVIVAQDTDFGTMLALQRTSYPSVILFRRRAKSVEALLPILLANLPSVTAELEAGAVVVFEDWRLRVRRLPFGGEPPGT